MSKDKLIGIILTIGSIVFFMLYIVLLPIQYILRESDFFGTSWNTINLGISWEIALMIPTLLGTFLLSFIVCWIGWTMATTPPPEPIDMSALDAEDIESEETNNE